MKLLCDIGNTTFTFYDGKKLFKKSVNSFEPSSIKEKVYFISVNHDINKKLFHLSNWINLEEKIDRSKYYETMGVDRIFTSKAVKTAVVVDAGSAITVDVVKDGEFIGGFIYPGINAFNEAFENISKALKCEFDFKIDFNTLPKDTTSALSYGFLAGLKKEVESYNLPIIITGGDALKFQKIFKDSIVDEFLIFKGMKKVIDD